MATLLKNIYSDIFFAELGTTAEKVIPGFRSSTFINNVQQADWENLELKQRIRRLSTVLQTSMPGNYRKQLTFLLKLIEALPKPSEVQYASLAYIFLPDFVEQFGQHDLNHSLQAMEKITPFTSCEFAIRPFLKSHPTQTLHQMLQWSKHPNEHVRRFASEGCRPRLPWGMAIEFLKKDPAPILPILNQLKNDQSEYVRRSVANNLNDISKDHPQLVVEIATQWLGKSSHTNRLLKHACRGLLKNGNIATLGLFGTSVDVPCRVSKLVCASSKISMGESLEFSFNVTLLAKEKARLRIEYRIYFMKANGQQQAKIFKISETLFNPNETISVSKKHAFKNLSTRKHYPGPHQIVIVVNGIARQQVSFLLE